MNHIGLLLSGLLGVILFTLTTIIGGVLNENYNHFSQFISELYANDAQNADLLRFYGYLPSGFCFIVFAFFLNRILEKSRVKIIGCFLFGFGYGFGTIICSIFNCDTGCNPEFINPSLSQILHNLMGMITYLIVPISILFIGFKIRNSKTHQSFKNISYLVALISFLFVIILNTNLQFSFKGIIQRIIEGSILFWVLYTSLYFSKNGVKKS